MVKKESHMSDPFVPAIAACLRYAGGPSQADLEDLVYRVLHRQPPAPTRQQLTELQAEIERLLPIGATALRWSTAARRRSRAMCLRRVDAGDTEGHEIVTYEG